MATTAKFLTFEVDGDKIVVKMRGEVVMRGSILMTTVVGNGAIFRHDGNLVVTEKPLATELHVFAE